MQRIELVGVGLCTLDVLIRTETLPTWHERIRVDQVSLDGGGPTGTALCAAAKLGVRAGFIGTAGTDQNAAQKLKSLQSFGLDISQVVRREGPENQIALVYVNKKTGERVFNVLQRFYDHPLKPQELDRDYITQAELMLMEGYHYEAGLAAASWMHEAGKKVVMDGGETHQPTLDPKKRHLVATTDILISSIGFAEALTGEPDFLQAGKAALGFGPEIVVITRGEEGSYYFSEEMTFHTPAFSVPVLDTTGAGDVFHGAFITGLLKGWTPKTICRFAAATAAIKCTGLGGRSAIPTFTQVQHFLQTNSSNPI
jgi:sulfofructose kinase